MNAAGAVSGIVGGCKAPIWIKWLLVSGLWEWGDCSCFKKELHIQFCIWYEWSGCKSLHDYDGNGTDYAKAVLRHRYRLLEEQDTAPAMKSVLKSGSEKMLR